MMLDYDLAKLYKVETKRINEAVYRNKEKFPKRFCFKLSYDESNNFLVANCHKKNERRGGRYKNSRVFTEQGVAMKKYISNNLIEQKYINELGLKDSKRIDLIEETLAIFKDLGNKCFAINMLEDNEYLNKILEKVHFECTLLFFVVTTTTFNFVFLFC